MTQDAPTDAAKYLAPGDHALGMRTGAVFVYRESEPFSEDWLVLKGVSGCGQVDVRISEIVWRVDAPNESTS